MALSLSALNDLLEAIRAGDGTDTLREAMRLVLQELIELEAIEVIGTACYERSEVTSPSGDLGVDRVDRMAPGQEMLHEQALQALHGHPHRHWRKSW